MNDHEQLTRAFTFARLPISIDGQRVSFGLELPEALIAVPIAGANFNGAVGLPREPGIARTTLVRSEVVEREIVSSPSKGRVHVAVVSTRARIADTQANERTVVAARDQLYDELKTRYPMLAPEDHSAAAELLFRACEDRGDTTLLDDARIIQTTRGDFVTLGALRTMARDGVLLAAEPDQSVDADLRDIGLPVLVAARARLCDALHGPTVCDANLSQCRCAVATPTTLGARWHSQRKSPCFRLERWPRLARQRAHRRRAHLHARFCRAR